MAAPTARPFAPPGTTGEIGAIAMPGEPVRHAPAVDHRDRRGTVELGKRRVRLRGAVLLVAGAATIALIAAFSAKLQGELLLGVGLVVVIGADLVGALSGFGNPLLEVEFAGDGEVGVLTGATITARGARQPLWARIGWWQPRWFTLEPDAPSWIALQPLARGTIRWIDVDLIARGPFGVWHVVRRDRIHLARAAHIGPRALEHRITFPPIPALPFGESVLTRGADDIVRGVRDYRPGDPRKLVHWPATAHHGRLLVRETETLGTIRVRIAADTPNPGSATDVTLGRVAWLALDCLARGWEVELLTTERQSVLGPPMLAPSPLARPPGCSLLHDMVANGGTWWPIGLPGPIYGYATPLPEPIVTRVGDVRSMAQLTERLAHATPGSLQIPHARIATRLVSPTGDRWL